MLGSSSFFQKKEQVGKAWIFGSLTKWLSSSVKELVFTHKCGSQKNNWKGQSRNLPWTPSSLLGLSKSPLELGVRTKNLKIYPTWENPKKVRTYMNNE
jgi:hypothetical protein